MAATTGSPGPPANVPEAEASDDQDPGASPNKRQKITVAAPAAEEDDDDDKEDDDEEEDDVDDDDDDNEEVSGSDNENSEPEGEHRRTATAEDAGASTAAPAVAARPPRLRVPPYPGPRNPNAVREWVKERERISKILAADPRNHLPTRRKPGDPGTTAAVQTPTDKATIRRAARSVVAVTATTSTKRDGGSRTTRKTAYTGIVMGDPRDARAMVVVTCSSTPCPSSPSRSPARPSSTRASSSSTTTTPATIGSRPSYGDGVFVLARDPSGSLNVRAGEIMWLERSDYLDRNYLMFLTGDNDGTGDGGPVIDRRAGDLAGMAFATSRHAAVVSVTTIATCLDMWAAHGRVARPVLGVWVRTVAMLDVALQEEIIAAAGRRRGVEVAAGGYIVDHVADDSAAVALGVQSGDVVSAFDGRRDLTLPELEDYFLSLGWRFLEDPSYVLELKLEEYDPMEKSKRSIALPVEFCDASERGSTF
ncbi:hypothetical protein ACP4OV_015036 [Aristida adscensionis]